MTKKDYIKMAKILQESRSHDELVNNLIVWFKQDNPNFNPTKFREAANARPTH